MKHLIGLIFLLLITLSVNAQEKATISGSITDSESGEELLGAAIFVKELSTGTTTNLYGFYSLTIPKGSYTLVYSFIGFNNIEQAIELQGNQKISIEMKIKGKTLKEFEVTAESAKKNVESVEMSTINMKMEAIKKIPALMGEVDVIKAIQMLPGVQTIGEGTSGFYVRGGAVDQNLVLLDEAPVYNASHLMGFFSVFNSDAIKDVQLYKGGIPAEYGGRLSSVLDIRMNEGNSKKFTAKGGIGTISSRLTLEAPIIKDKSSFMLSGRRTYADVFLKLSKDTNLQKQKLYFWDLNLKANYKINENNRIFLSGYSGRDVLGGDEQFQIRWGNKTATLRWNHIYNAKLFSNVTLLYSKFDYFLGEPTGAEAFSWTSDITDYTAKVDYNYFANPNNTIKFGLHSTYHKFNPGFVAGEGDETIFNSLQLAKINALEHAVYFSNEHKISPRITAVYGMRYSMFQNVGPATVYGYDSLYAVQDTSTSGKGEVYQTYGGFEPRLGVKYSLNEMSSVKLSYNRTRQYVHLASNTTSSSPLDIWFPSSPNIGPQLADQVAVGYFRNFLDNKYETSVEVYYKKMQNSIDFSDHAQLLLNPYLEGELRIGEARAYGLEVMLQRQRGRFTGFVSYTLARTEKYIPDISPDWYPAKYDKTHDVSIVGTFQISKRLEVSANWVYSTGAAVTMPTGRFEYAGMIVPVYSSRNGARLPAYHRADIAFLLKSKEKEGKRWTGDWVFSIYNLYARHNAFSINFRQDEDDPTKTYAEKTYLFGIVPSITYNFKF
jgi:hypothetical protein